MTAGARETNNLQRGTCSICGCTDADCSGCVERTGEACEWADKAHTICSAHPTNLVVMQFMDTGIQQ